MARKSQPNGPTLFLADKARNSLREIARHTQRHWGYRQRQKYITGLRDRFVRITEAPLDGRPYKDELRHVKEGKHLIFYVMRDHGILIVDILHESMDIATCMERWTQP